MKLFRRKQKSDKRPIPRKHGGFTFDSDPSNGEATSGKADEQTPVLRQKQSDKKLLPHLEPQQFEVDQFKTLRTRILFPSSGKQPRSIAVTSAVPGEGKSFVAANLAISIAQNIDKEQTLLVDCDMRLPSVHRIFGYEAVAGLSEYLSADAPLSDLLIRPRLIGNLSILPGGTPPENPAELLSSKKMLDLLKDVQSRYDDRYIIIDLPPPVLAAEANVIARAVDAVVVVVNYGHTSRSKVSELIEMLGTDQVLGIVLNRFDTSMHSSAYRMYLKYIRRKEV
ncbi:CpsD/CapB family tyrosine-protein kinase [Desulfonema ishimotonii]|uniref:CpsD/CapB family tyrosine-protein kinase n=1 Tax=Desulfonema ishimotonii TaxID=45657 RepID=UPI00140C8A58|nr:CpsD/CapB family tyrosine-protein kinase [Desulfonema ishimotonii]